MSPLCTYAVPMEQETIDVGIACCQVALQIGDVAANLAVLEASIKSAARGGAKVIVLPELASTGYCFRDADEARALAIEAWEPTIASWSALSEEFGAVVIGGLAELDVDTLYNSAVIIDSGSVTATYRKAHLWNREKEIFAAGAAHPPVVETSQGRIAVMICYDLEFPEWVRSVALRGAELLAAPVNWPNFARPSGERPGEIVRVQADASVNRLAIAACDRAGVERGTDWVGGSVIVDADGYPHSPITLGESALAFARLDLTQSRDKSISERNDVLADRRPELYEADPARR